MNRRLPAFVLAFALLGLASIPPSVSALEPGREARTPDDATEPELHPDPETLTFSMDSDIPVGLAASVLRANCRYETTSFEDADAYRSATDGTCEAPRFESIQFAIAK